MSVAVFLFDGYNGISELHKILWTRGQKIAMMKS